MFACVVIEKELFSPPDVMERAVPILERFSPTIEVDGPYRYFLDLGTNGSSLIGKELIHALHLESSLRAKVGFGQSLFIASVAALSTGKSGWRAVEKGEELAFLQKVNISRLPLSKEVVRRFSLLGIETAGDVASLPPNDLVRLLGGEAQHVVEIVAGVQQRPLNALPERQPLLLEEELEGAIESSAVLIAVLDKLINDLCGLLKDRGQRCAGLLVALDLEEGGQEVIDIAFTSPFSEPKRIWNVLKGRMERLQLAGPVVSIAVTAKGLVASYAIQDDFTNSRAALSEKVDRLVDRLESRERGATLLRVIWDDPLSRIPERHAHLEAICDKETCHPLLLPRPLQVSADKNGTPKVVQTRSGWSAVDRVLERWELSDEWWCDRPLKRFYYRVLLRNGAVIRLFEDRFHGGWFHQSR